MAATSASAPVGLQQRLAGWLGRHHHACTHTLTM